VPANVIKNIISALFISEDLQITLSFLSYSVYVVNDQELGPLKY